MGRFRLLAPARRARTTAVAATMATAMATVAATAVSAWSLAGPGLNSLRAPDSSSCTVRLELPSPAHNIVPAHSRADLSIPLVVVASPTNHRGGQVRLTVGSLPQHVSGLAVPDRLPVRGPVTRAPAAIRLHVDDDAATGSYPVPITARCGDSSFSIDALLVVLPATPAKGLVVTPGETTIPVGGVARFCVSATIGSGTTPDEPALRHGRHRRTASAPPAPQPPFVVTGVPTGAHAAVTPAGPHDGGCAHLTVFTSASTLAGDYPLTVIGGAQDHRRSVVTLLHVVAAQLVAFSISGDLQGELYPGVSLPLDLRITNPTATRIRLTSLSVSLDHLDAAHAAQCPWPDNYRIGPFTGATDTLVIPPHGQATLSGLGLPASDWPQVSMLETDVDQSPCLGSTLSLTYQGTAVPL